MNYSCQHKGDYYITAFYAKENVRYINHKYPPAYNLANLKRYCKGAKIVLLMYESHSMPKYQADWSKKVTYKGNVDSRSGHCDSKYCNWRILCGDVKVSRRKNRNTDVINNDFDNFMAIELYNSNWGIEMKDNSIDWWLELTKDL